VESCRNAKVFVGNAFAPEHSVGDGRRGPSSHPDHATENPLISFYILISSRLPEMSVSSCLPSSGTDSRSLLERPMQEIILPTSLSAQPIVVYPRSKWHEEPPDQKPQVSPVPIPPDRDLGDGHFSITSRKPQPGRQVGRKEDSSSTDQGRRVPASQAAARRSTKIKIELAACAPSLRRWLHVPRARTCV